MRSVLGAVGRVLVTTGILLLLFVAYQLWGTGIYQARAQDDLRSQFEQSLRHGGTTTTTTPPTSTSTPATDATTTTTFAPLTLPPPGDALGIIAIPKIGVNQVVVEGVDVEDLRKGPGHYPGTQLPGHEGNSAIAGHRTTYGAPFGDLDQLVPGDEIDIATLQGKFKYTVTEQRVVDPSEVSVLDPIVDPARPGHQLATLTLTTCNPKYSAAQRLVIQARLVPTPSRPLPLPPTEATKGRAATTINGLSGETSSPRARSPLGFDRRTDRRGLVGPVPPPPALDHVADRRRAVPRHALRLLHVRRAAVAVELLTRSLSDAERSRLVDERDDGARRDGGAGLDVELPHDARNVGQHDDAPGLRLEHRDLVFFRDHLALVDIDAENSAFAGRAQLVHEREDTRGVRTDVGTVCA